MTRAASWLAAWLVVAPIVFAGCAPGALPDTAPGQAGATTPDAPTDAAALRDASPDAAPSTVTHGTITFVDPASYDGPRVAPGADLSAPHEIVRRACEVRRYGSSWTIEPGVWCSGLGCGPGIVCTRPQACPASPHARCLTSVGGRCDYGGAPTTETACVADEECQARPGGRCLGVISQT